ncbi:MULTISPECIES: ABC transporter permease [unclassified Paenibacillus]|uniref:ABC transporter permease n=1 Tax=unclassified Paenibacillus TaxID=185978 RepID=UPI001B766FD4|nr:MULTISPECIES: ABC transporter permease [unclassified Paenibacillus]MBP1154491.1 NitT/TauT family transport system permease protein [Paenibacillus sp. PvP091]MBP1170125.1 NitT/TauT family transport system permease protein [Paenibacillus sp. PvR098]MBP2441153.1 NitT/TauT family transport system permease protein [Paenibacillus sp. PvP052]
MRNYVSRTTSITLTLLGLFAVWEVACRILQVPEYLMPTPMNIVERFIQDWSVIVSHSGITLSEVLLGFTMSVFIGIPIAILIVYSKYFSNSVFPILIGIHCVPMISFAPLLIIWFGFGMLTKVLIAFMISFFPIVINTVVGLQSMEKDMFHLAKSLRANKMQTFIYFRLPKALPSIFGGLKVGITLAVVGAVVAEFVSSQKGLGYLQLTAHSQLDVTMEFCVIFTLAFIGIGLFSIIGWIERLSMPWYRATRKEEA